MAATHASSRPSRNPLARLLPPLLAAVLAACGGSGSSAPPAAPAAAGPVTVDAGGGTVTGPGGATVTVPPGATSAPVTIQIAEDATGAPAMPAGVAAAGRIYAVTPHGALFDRPVTVRIPYDSAGVTGDQDLALLQAEPGGSWSRVQTLVRGPGEVLAQVTGFSFFTVGVMPPLGPALSLAPTVQVVGGQTLPVPLEDHLGRPHLISMRVSNAPGCPDGSRPVVHPLMHAYFYPEDQAPAYVPWEFWGRANPLGADGTVTVPMVNQWSYFLPMPHAYGPRFWKPGVALVCGSQVLLRAEPPDAWLPYSGATATILGVSHLDDLTVPSGSSPSLRAAILGGPLPGGDSWGLSDGDQYQLEWQRSQDGGQSWRTFATAFQRDAVPDLTLKDFAVYWSAATLPPAGAADDGALLRAVACYAPPGGARDCVLSRSARLTVTSDSAPSFTAQPADALVSAGGTATFTVAVAGTPAPALRWQASAPGSATWIDVAGATGTSYTTPAAVLADSGTMVRAVATNGLGTATSGTAMLAVAIAPMAPLIVSQPIGLSVPAGASVTLAVGATGTAPLAYQWSLNGAPIAGATAALYTLAAATAADAGSYTVTVSNGVSPAATSVPATLAVLDAPVVATPPAPVTVNAGQAATFTVVANGAAPLSYQWLRNGVAVAGATGASYTTPATATADGGAVFSVLVFNPAGAVVSAGAVLTVVVPPPPPPLAVTAVTPASGSTGNASAATTVQVTFSAPLDCTAATAASLRVFEGTVAVPGSAACAGSTLTFQPSPALPTATGLTGWVDAAVRSLAGGTLGASVGWSFGMAPWTRQPGTAAFDQANAVATDAAGDVFVVGSTQGGLDGNVLGGLYDAFAVKYVPSGARLWTRQLGGATGEITLGLGSATDAAGNLYVVGETFASLDGVANAGASDAFVVKYDAAGTRQWTRLIGTAAGDAAAAAVTDAAGNLYVAGWTGGVLAGTASAGLDDLFVAKLDPAGTTLWTRQLGGSNYDDAKAVAVDGAGNVYVAGSTQGDLDGNLHVGSTNTVDGFLVKYDGAGTKLWTRTFGTTADEWTYGVAADGAGNAYVVGRTQGNLDGNVNADPAGLTSDAFLLKYDATGAKQWTRQLGTTASDSFGAVAIDGAGNLFVAGATGGALEAGSTNATGNNLLVARFDAAGTLAWLHQRGSGAGTNDGAVAVATDPFGGVFAAGLTNGGLDGNASAGGYDAYVVKVQAGGIQR